MTTRSTRSSQLLACAAFATLALSAAAPASAAGATYDNPVLSGFNPDPSVCRVGSDYYLATSSFEYFPGVPIYHSRDLVNWRQIGHALTRVSQLPLEGQKSSKGIFAPTLRCQDGTFYLVTTNIENGGSFYVTTKDPAGEWSEPVWLKEPTFGMDPSLLFDDDGKVYYTRHGGGERGGAYQAELDLATGKLKADVRQIWAGTGGVWPEGPHLYKVNGMYYLLQSEGGTSYNHSLTMARSSTPWGPFEPAPGNPLLTHRDHPELPIQATGHGDLVQTPEGKWWMIMLGIRPVNKQHHLGRETLLAPVSWDDKGWLVVNGGKPIQERMSADGLPPLKPWPVAPVRDDFNQPRLGLEWTFLRGPATGLWSLSEAPGTLRLKGSAATLDDVAMPAFVGRRQQHMRMRAATELKFDPAAKDDIAGLALRMNEEHHYTLRIAGQPRRVELVTRVAGKSTVQKSAPLGAGPVTLQITSTPERYDFSFKSGKGKLRTIGTAPTNDLSTEKAGGFTGVFVGMFASGAKAPAADFAWFDYQPLSK